MTMPLNPMMDPMMQPSNVILLKYCINYAMLDLTYEGKVLHDMEKIKDLIYDYSDLFLALLITMAMVGIVYINLTTIFDDSVLAIPDPSSVLIGGSEISSELDTSSETIIIDLNDPIAENTDVEDSRHESEPETVTTEPSTPPTPAAPPVTGEMVTVTIPNGTPGIGIARILVENQLLPDTTAFVQAAEEMELALKLKSGTFQIPAGSSPEQMVRIIAGQ